MWKKQPLEGKCKECNSNKFILVGTGLEKVFEEIKKFFKSARIIKLSSDDMDRENFAKTLRQIEQNKDRYHNRNSNNI